MNRLQVAAVCIGLMGAGPALAGDPDYHELVVHLPDSGKIVYSVSRDTTKEADGQKQSVSVSYVTESTFKRDQDAYHFLPKVTKAVLNNFNGMVPPAGVDTSGFTQPFVLIDGIGYAADDSLQPVSIDDTAALRQKLIGLMTKGLTQQAGPGREKQIADAAENAAKATFDVLGAEGVAKGYVPDQTMLSWPHNAGLTLGHPTVTDAQVAFPLAGGTIKVNQTMSLESWAPDKDLAVVTWTSIPDPESLSAAVRSGASVLMAQLAGEAAEDGPVDFGKFVVKADVRCRYEISIKTALVRKGDCTTVKGVSMADKGQMTTEHAVMSESLLP